MSIRTIKLTRRRILASLMVISLAGAAAGAGTMAFFSDTEASNGNTVSAGTLDLKVNGADQNVQLINVTNAAPGDRGGNSTTLQNNGSIDGYLDFNVTVSGSDNGDNEAEPDSGPDSELPENLDVNVYFQNGPNVTNGWMNASQLEGNWDEDVSLNASETKTLVVKWKIPTGVGNAIQSDSVTVDVTFELHQQANDS